MSEAPFRTAVELGTVQETLLTPLYARARQWGRDDAIVDDPQARKIVDSIDYDFTSLEKFPDTLTGCAIRASIFDPWIESFLEKDDSATAIVLIGEGLDTTFERNDDGRANWFELDFPDVIDLRRRCFAENSRRRCIAGNALDGDWIDEVAGAKCDQYLFQIAGVLMYLPEDSVRGLLTMLADHFPGCTVLFDTCSTLALRNSHRWEATVRTTGAKYQWGIDDPTAISQWDRRFRVSDVVYQLEQHRQQWSLKTRLASRLSRRLRHSYPCCRSILGQAALN